MVTGSSWQIWLKQRLKQRLQLTVKLTGDVRRAPVELHAQAAASVDGQVDRRRVTCSCRVTRRQTSHVPAGGCRRASRRDALQLQNMLDESSNLRLSALRKLRAQSQTVTGDAKEIRSCRFECCEDTVTGTMQVQNHVPWLRWQLRY